MSNTQIVSEDIIRLAAKAGAEAALEKMEKEKQKQIKGRQDARLRNTRLLLRNYRRFKKHSAGAVYTASQVNENIIDILGKIWIPSYEGDVFIESIKKSAKRTQLILTHIDKMLEIYKSICENSLKYEDKRRYRVIYAMYIFDDITTAEEIAEAEKINPRTVYKDIDAAIEEISSLMFGIDFVI